jgi:hypothetical protein
MYDEERVATIAVLQKKLNDLTKAALDCGISSDNPDTCGVCHLHFAECEEDQVCVGDEVNEHDIPIGRAPACPGARVRAVLNGN